MTPLRLYLDVCAIQRPMDDLAQLRVRLESEAVLGALAAVASGRAVLVVSDVHHAEVRRTPYPSRRDYATEVLALASETIALSGEAEARARAFAAEHITGPDSLHLAVAIEAQADYFCTTDDRLIRRSTRVDTGRVTVVSPLHLAAFLDAR